MTLSSATELRRKAARPAGRGEGAGRLDGERGGGERRVGDWAALGKRGSDDSDSDGRASGDTGGVIVGVGGADLGAASDAIFDVVDLLGLGVGLAGE